MANYKEKVGALLEVAQEEDMDLLSMCFESISNYIKTVVEVETGIQMAYFKYEGSLYRYHVGELDKARRLVHNTSLANMTIVNRVCKMYNVDIIFEVGNLDRTEIADKVMKPFVDEYFSTRRV